MTAEELAAEIAEVNQATASAFIVLAEMLSEKGVISKAELLARLRKLPSEVAADVDGAMFRDCIAAISNGLEEHK